MAGSFAAGSVGAGDIPICKNFRFGTCERGAECRYLHSKETPAAMTAELSRRARRPAVHCIVLYASDTKMMQYAKHVARRFNDAGIDVFVNTDLTEVGLGDSGTGPGQQIKVEHLSTVLRDSPGNGWDYAIVLGDKNMKNGSVQARKSGKLQEVLLDDRISSLLDNWATQYGITSVSSVSDSERTVSHLSRDQLCERVQSLLVPYATHLADRLHKIEATANEVLDARARQLAAWRPPAASPASSASILRPVPPPLLPTDTSSYSSQDTAMVERITRVQTGIVKLYRELAHAAYLLKHVSAQKAAPKGKSGASSASAAFRDLGLGKGSLLDPSHKPVAGAAGAGSSAVSSLPSFLHEKLTSFLSAELQGLESIGVRLVEACVPGSTATGATGSGSKGQATGAMAMWRTFLAQYKQAEQKDKLAAFFGDAGSVVEPSSSGKSNAASAAGTTGPTTRDGHAGSKAAAVSAEGEFQEQVSGHGRRRKGSGAADAPLSSLGTGGLSSTTGGAGGFTTGAAPVQRKDSIESRGSAAGGWSCSVCTLKNRAGSDSCEACGAEAPGHTWAPVGATPAGGQQATSANGGGVRAQGKGPAPGTLAAVVAGISPGKSDSQAGMQKSTQQGTSKTDHHHVVHTGGAGTAAQQQGKKQTGTSSAPAPAATVLSQTSKTTPVSSHGSVLTTATAATVSEGMLGGGDGSTRTGATAASKVPQSEWPGLAASASSVGPVGKGEREAVVQPTQPVQPAADALSLPTTVGETLLAPSLSAATPASVSNADKGSAGIDQAALLWQALQAQAMKGVLPLPGTGTGAGASEAAKQSQLQAQAAALASLQALQMQVQQQQAQISTLLKLNQSLALVTANQQQQQAAQQVAQQQQQQQQQRAMATAAMSMGGMPAGLSQAGGLGLGATASMGGVPPMNSWPSNVLSMPAGRPTSIGAGTGASGGGGPLGLGSAIGGGLAMPHAAGAPSALGLGSLTGLPGLHGPAGLGMGGGLGGLSLQGHSGSNTASGAATHGSTTLLGLDSPPHAAGGAGGGLMPGLSLGMGLGSGGLGPSLGLGGEGSIAGLDVSVLQSLGLLPQGSPTMDAAQQGRGTSSNAKGAAYPCAVCGAPSALSCDSCASEPPYQPTYYCSTQHQQQDWARHKAKHSK